MEKEKLEFVKGKTQELLQSQTCCAEGKAAAKAWLEAIGTEQEAAETCLLYTSPSPRDTR